MKTKTKKEIIRKVTIDLGAKGPEKRGSTSAFHAKRRSMPQTLRSIQ